MKILHIGSIFLYFLLSNEDPTETQLEEIPGTTSSPRQSYRHTVRLRSHSYASESGILHLFPSRGHHKVVGRGVTRATLAVKMWWREHLCSGPH